VTVLAAEAGTRPEAPRRAVTMLVPLLLAAAALIVGAATAGIAQGAIWGLIGGTGLYLGLRLGRIEANLADGLLLLAGFITSTILAVTVLPGAPESMDVLVTLRFAGAWAPAGLASAVVAARHGAGRSSTANVVVIWLIAGVLALPATQTFGLLEPLDQLRRGAESDFGISAYMTIAMVIAGLAVASLLAVVSRLPTLGTASGLAIISLYAAASVGFSIPAVIEGFADIVNIPNLLPPDFEWAIGEGSWWWLPSWEFGAPERANPLVETIRMGVIATVLGCAVALPLAFLASTLTSLNHSLYLAAKGFMNVTRTIPDLFWAVILVAAVGGGAFAGAVALAVFAMAIMSKLLSETIDAANPGPLEAAKATGSRHFPAVRSSVLPQVLASYVAYALYIFELTIRASAVVGLVGAGGIGRVLEAQRVFYRFDRILAIVIVIVVVVFILDQISAAMRRRLV
jgi:phosphonate transport system permease protein